MTPERVGTIPDMELIENDGKTVAIRLSPTEATLNQSLVLGVGLSGALLKGAQSCVHRSQKVEQLVVPSSSHVSILRPVRIDEKRRYEGDEKRKKCHTADDHHTAENTSPRSVWNNIAVTDRAKRLDRPPHADPECTKVPTVDQVRDQPSDDGGRRGYAHEIRKDPLFLNGYRCTPVKTRLNVWDTHTTPTAHLQTVARGPDDVPVEWASVQE